MVLVAVELFAMNTLCVWSGLGSWPGASVSRLIKSLCVSTSVWSQMVASSLAALCGPTTSTEVVLSSTFVTFLAKCWTISWWMWCTAFAAYSTWSTFGSVDCVAFLELEGLYLINCSSYHSSTIGLVPVEVLDCHLVFFCVLEECFICDILSLLFGPNPFLTSKCLVAWKSNSVLHTSFSASLVYWHLLTMFLMCWSNWSVDSCSLCLMSLYISSM